MDTNYTNTNAANDFWQGKKVFVTGGNGFLGSWLIKNLVDQGADVVALIRDIIPSANLSLLGYDKKITIIYGKVEDYDLLVRILHEYEIDTCFHLAAQALVGVANKSPLSTFESNIKGTWCILEACRMASSIKRIVIASSDKAYGSHEKLPYTEEGKLHGLHPYDASKSCTDILSQTYYNTYKLPVAILRCGNIYGGGDLNFSRIIPDTARSIFSDKNPIIRSDGLFKRDYIHVMDVVNAYLTVAEQLQRQEIQGQAFNFGTEKPITVIELVTMMLKLAGKQDLKPVVLNEAKYEIREQYLSIAKARKLLLWNPQILLEEGLRMTLEWYWKYLEINNK